MVKYVFDFADSFYVGYSEWKKLHPECIPYLDIFLEEFQTSDPTIGIMNPHQLHSLTNSFIQQVSKLGKVMPSLTGIWSKDLPSNIKIWKTILKGKPVKTHTSAHRLVYEVYPEINGEIRVNVTNCWLHMYKKYDYLFSTKLGRDIFRSYNDLDDQVKNFSDISIKGFPGYRLKGDRVFRNGKEVKSYDNGKGYRQVKLYKDGKRYTKQIHRLVLGEPSGDVDHKDQNKSNNSKSNLQAVTHSENIKRIFKKKS